MADVPDTPEQYEEVIVYYSALRITENDLTLHFEYDEYISPCYIARQCRSYLSTHRSKEGIIHAAMLNGAEAIDQTTFLDHWDNVENAADPQVRAVIDIDYDAGTFGYMQPGQRMATFSMKAACAAASHAFSTDITDSADRQALFEEALAGKEIALENLGPQSQAPTPWDDEEQRLITACRGATSISSTEYPEQIYPWAFVRYDTMDDLLQRLKYGGWCVRTGFVYKDIAFAQQVNGGDEWLVLKRNGSEWVDFESYSLEHLLEKKGEDYLRRLIEQLVTASPDDLGIRAPEPTGSHGLDDMSQG